MEPRRKRLILFTRYPLPGRAKTRLIRALGAEGAAELQRDMTSHTLHTARALAAQGIAQLEIRFDGHHRGDMRRWLGTRVPLRDQGDGDLGQRLQRAFAEAFAVGAHPVVIIGTDCPGLDVPRLQQAFDTLANTDVVLGPASDGGYYLLGLKRPEPSLTEGIPWGTNTVLEQTLARIQRRSLGHVLLPELADVDRPEDLVVWRKAHRQASTLAVIIPTLNEAGHLANTLESVRRDEPDQILVVDGGSQDSTVSVARQWGADIIQGPRGRARQMNAGAARTSAGLLLFLHADTHPPPGYRKLIQTTLSRPAVSAGAFSFAIREATPYRRSIECCVAARCRWWKTPFGDQGLFLRRPLFEAIGGFPDWPILEDVEIVRRLKVHGELAIEGATASTSGRRWLSRGFWNTFWINQAILLGHRLVISKERLARLYRSSEESPLRE